MRVREPCSAEALGGGAARRIGERRAEGGAGRCCGVGWTAERWAVCVEGERALDSEIVTLFSF